MGNIGNDICYKGLKKFASKGVLLVGCGTTYTLRHTLFLSDISTYLSHLHHLTMGVAKSILYATPVGA